MRGLKYLEKVFACADFYGTDGLGGGGRSNRGGTISGGVGDSSLGSGGGSYSGGGSLGGGSGNGGGGRGYDGGASSAASIGAGFNGSALGGGWGGNSSATAGGSFSSLGSALARSLARQGVTAGPGGTFGAMGAGMLGYDAGYNSGKAARDAAASIAMGVKGRDLAGIGWGGSPGYGLADTPTGMDLISRGLVSPTVLGGLMTNAKAMERNKAEDFKGWAYGTDTTESARRQAKKELTQQLVGAAKNAEQALYGDPAAYDALAANDLDALAAMGYDVTGIRDANMARTGLLGLGGLMSRADTYTSDVDKALASGFVSRDPVTGELSMTNKSAAKLAGPGLSMMSGPVASAAYDMTGSVPGASVVQGAIGALGSTMSYGPPGLGLLGSVTGIPGLGMLGNAYGMAAAGKRAQDLGVSAPDVSRSAPSENGGNGYGANPAAARIALAASDGADDWFARYMEYKRAGYA